MIKSAGIIPFRMGDKGEMEFLLGHPGGCRANYWSLLKGQLEEGESIPDAALREFKEESGLLMFDCKSQMLIPLGSVVQSKKKTVYAFGLHYPNIDPKKCYSNMADGCPWPEIDQYRWMTYDQLKDVTHPTHLAFYRKLIETETWYANYYKEQRRDIRH